MSMPIGINALGSESLELITGPSQLVRLEGSEFPTLGSQGTFRDQ